MTKKSMKARKPQGRCIFCGRTGLSKEHIWSDWLTDVIPRNDQHGEYWGSMHRDAGSAEFEWNEPSQSASRQGSVLQRKLRNVCERHCNNGWMSRVVKRAKPLVERTIRGKDFELNRREQTDLAAWIGITTIMQEFAKRLGVQRIPPEDRTVLMTREAPPLSWSIWIARYTGKWWAPMHHYHLPMTFSKQPDGNEPSPSGGELQLTTFTLGELLVHVFTSTQAEMIETYRSYIDGTSNSAKLRQLWPIVDDRLNWPLSSSFGDDEVDSLAFDWVEKQWGVRGLPGRPQERDILRLANWVASIIQAGR